jgi:hypothetical protein
MISVAIISMEFFCGWGNPDRVLSKPERFSDLAGKADYKISEITFGFNSTSFGRDSSLVRLGMAVSALNLKIRIQTEPVKISSA